MFAHSFPLCLAGRIHAAKPLGLATANPPDTSSLPDPQPRRPVLCLRPDKYSPPYSHLNSWIIIAISNLIPRDDDRIGPGPAGRMLAGKKLVVPTADEWIPKRGVGRMMRISSD